MFTVHFCSLFLCACQLNTFHFNFVHSVHISCSLEFNSVQCCVFGFVLCYLALKKLLDLFSSCIGIFNQFAITFHFLAFAFRFLFYIAVAFHTSTSLHCIYPKTKIKQKTLHCILDFSFHFYISVSCARCFHLILCSLFYFICLLVSDTLNFPLLQATVFKFLFSIYKTKYPCFFFTLPLSNTSQTTSLCHSSLPQPSCHYPITIYQLLSATLHFLKQRSCHYPITIYQQYIFLFYRNEVRNIRPLGINNFHTQLVVREWLD